jgi:hypothetical protein
LGFTFSLNCFGFSVKFSKSNSIIFLFPSANLNNFDVCLKIKKIIKATGTASAKIIFNFL